MKRFKGKKILFPDETDIHFSFSDNLLKFQ